MTRERRDSYRFEVNEGLVRVDAPHGLEDVRLADLSASGGSLVLPGGLALEIGGAPFVLEPGGYSPFRTRLLPVRSFEEAGLVRVGVRFESMDRAALESLSLFLIDRFREESGQVSRLLAAAGLSMASFRREMVVRLLARYAMGRPLRVYAGEVRVPLRLRARTIRVEAARQVIVAEVQRGSAEMMPAGREYMFTFLGPNSVNHFTSTVWRTAPGVVVVLMPPEIRQVGFRDSPRLRPRTPVSVAFAHPRLAGLRLRKDVMDVSGRGLSFDLDPRNDVLFPGERLGRVRLELPRGQVRAEAAIRSVMPHRQREGLACGLEILGFPEEREAERWRRFVFREGHPRLRLGHEDLVEQAWETLRSSGYVDLLDEAERTHMERRFLETWKGHAQASSVSRFFLLEKEERSVGTAAVSLLYPRTWMAHHFGIDLDERRSRRTLFDLAREIYSGTMFLLGHMTPSEHFVFYFDAAKPWHDLFFGQFVERYTDKADMVYDGFRLYKRLLGDPVEPLPGHGPEIVEADPDLMERLARHLEQEIPKLELDAYSLSSREIGLETFTRECLHKGYERTRTVLFALRGTTPIAALVAETGQEGVNVFGLLNRCWIVGMEPGADDDPAVKEALLARAVRHYSALGKHAFLFLDDTAGEPGDVMAQLGFSCVADGRRWLARQRVIPAYLGYMEEVITGIKT